MKKYIFLLILSLIFIFVSCEPRIDMDMTQWGDHAYIDNVDLFKMESDDAVKLWEWYHNNGQIPVSGVRTITISVGKAVIDSSSATANVTLKAGESLQYSALRIYHKSIKVEPVENSPNAGLISDLTARQFKYKLLSADGTEREWTIIIQ